MSAFVLCFSFQTRLTCPSYNYNIEFRLLHICGTSFILNSNFTYNIVKLTFSFWSNKWNVRQKYQDGRENQVPENKPGVTYLGDESINLVIRSNIWYKYQTTIFIHNTFSVSCFIYLYYVKAAVIFHVIFRNI